MRRLRCLAHIFTGLMAFAFLARGNAALAADENAGFDWFKPFSKLTGEYSFEETYVGEASVKRGGHEVSNFDEHDTTFEFILTPRIKLGVLRLGLAWERFSFGFPGHTPLPNTFQSANLVLGIDTQISDSILLRVEAQPGFYGTNNPEADQINVPFLAGGTYIYNPNIQFILGVSVDVERDYPVIPAAGIRYRINREWLANLVLPTPRIEYTPAKSMTLYVGANIKQTNFRMENDFGDTHGIGKLNHAVLSYSELRGGIGVDWKLAKFATLSVEAGYQPYRSFDFYRADIRFHEDGSAPYGMISIHGAF